MFPRLTVDQQSFEQLLSAASFIQQLNRQCLQTVPFDANSASTLSAMVETQQAIETGALDMEGATDRVVDLAVRVTGAQSAVTWIFTEHGFVYRAGAGSGAGDERIRLEVLSRLAALDDSGSASSVDLSALWNSAPDPLPAASMKSMVIAPIFQGQKIAGGLAVFSGTADAFTEQDRTSTRLLAGLLAHALGKSTESHLHRTVSFERATVMQAIDQLILSLSKLAEPVKADDCVPQAKAAIALSEVPALEPSLQQTPVYEPHPVRVVPPEVIGAVLPTQHRPVPPPAVLPGQVADFDGPPLWLDKDRNKKDEARQTAAPLAAQPWFLAFNVRPPGGESARASSLPAIANECRLRALSLAAASWHALAQARRDLRPSLTAAANFIAGQWRSGRDELSRAVNQMAMLVDSALRYRVRVRIPANSQGYYPLGLAGAGTGLLMMAFFLVLTTGMRRNPEDVSASAGTEIQTTEAGVTTPSANRVARDRSARPGAVTAGRQHPPTPDAASFLPSSHMQVTDRSTESALRSLSPFEIPALRRRASYGDDSAAFLLGMAYETGHGVRRSCVRAVEWVVRSANQGNPAAQFNLALRYHSGDGVPADPQEAEKWLKKAAARRYSGALLIRSPQAATDPM